MKKIKKTTSSTKLSTKKSTSKSGKSEGKKSKKISRTSASGFGGINPRAGGSTVFKPENYVVMTKLGPEFNQYRFIGNPLGILFVEIPIETPKGQFNIMKQCLAYDPATDTIDESKECPYLDLPYVNQKMYYFCNVIDREAQENEPRRKGKSTKKELKTGFKDLESDSWTPCKVQRLTRSMATTLRQLKQINIHKVKGVKKAFDITDPKYGMDINLSFDKDKAGADMYQIQRGDSQPLTVEEKGYLIWNLNNLHQPESLELAIREAEKLKEKIYNPNDEDDDDDDDDLKSKKKSKKKSSKSKSSSSSKKKKGSLNKKKRMKL